MLSAYQELLDGFVAIRQRPAQPCAGRRLAYQLLLDEFTPIHDRCVLKEVRTAHRQREALPSLLDGFQVAVDVWRVSQKETASDFNLLEVMQLTGKEIRHSMVLAWLLDWDLTGVGTHAQGNLGLRLFLRELHSELSLDESCATPPYFTRREVADNESRLDIQIWAPARFLIGIEVKVWAEEGLDQTQREWRELKRRAESLKIPDRAVHALFLTPDGATPEDPNFRPVTWRRLSRVFRAFSEEAVPQDVKLFARHYARTLERFIIQASDEEEDSDERATV